MKQGADIIVDNEQTISESKSAESKSSEAEGPGELLKAAREAMNLTTQQVAKKLNFKNTLVLNIEANIFDSDLPSAYNRGYLRNYAKLVNASQQEVLARYEQLGIMQKANLDMQSFSNQTVHQAENNRLMWLTYFIVAILIAASVYWWYQSSPAQPVNIEQNPNQVMSSDANDVSTNDSIIAAPAQVEQSSLSTVDDNANNMSADNTDVESIDADNTDAGNNIDAGNANTENSTATGLVSDVEAPVTTAGEQSSTETVAQNQDSGQVTPSAQTSDEPAQGLERIIPAVHSQTIADTSTETETDIAQTQPQAQSQATSDVIASANDDSPVTISHAVFTFSGDCWVNIYDATGERIAWGIKKADYVMNISGVAPFNVTLGKPELVTIVYNEQSVDMSKFNKGNIAKFSLPL